MRGLDDYLVDGWRRSWRWFSMQMHLAASFVLMSMQVLPFLPAEVQRLIPQPWGWIVTLVWFAIGIVARLKKQGKRDGC